MICMTLIWAHNLAEVRISIRDIVHDSNGFSHTRDWRKGKTNTADYFSELPLCTKRSSLFGCGGKSFMEGRFSSLQQGRNKSLKVPCPLGLRFQASCQSLYRDAGGTQDLVNGSQKDPAGSQRASQQLDYHVLLYLLNLQKCVQFSLGTKKVGIVTSKCFWFLNRGNNPLCMQQVQHSKQRYFFVRYNRHIWWH